MSKKSPVALNLATNITTLRKLKRMSQVRLAELAQIPRTTLTHIESGSGNPSLQNLAKISTALQVSIEELLSKPRNECDLIPFAHLPEQKRSQGRARLYQILPEKIKGLSLERLEIDSGAMMGGHPHLPGAKEYLTVIEGELRMHVAGEVYLVKKGDVFAFPGDQAHSYQNAGKTNALALSIVLPVTFNF